MSEPSEPLRAVPAAQQSDVVDLVDYCARPMCRLEFRQSTGRGRRRDYCSETCRRLADREYKQARAMVEQFERLARRSRHDVRAFGRSNDEANDAEVPAEITHERAVAGIDRARAVLRFVDPTESPLASELAALCDAVEPELRLVR